MIIDNTILNVELEIVIQDLQEQLISNNIQLLRVTKKSGKDIMCQCPYHSNGQERKPSAGIRREDGVFHCFSCGEIHSLPEVISYCFGKEDGGAFGWNWLLKHYISVERDERKDIRLDFGRNLSAKEGIVLAEAFGEGLREGMEIVTEEELESYRYIHPYMYRRKLTDEIIELFDIGYDKSTDCITFPIKDEEGNCLFIARRSVKTKWFNYPEGVEKPLYGLYELHYVMCTDFNPLWSYYQFHRGDAKEIIICESMLDALTCWVYGRYALAMNGTGNELQFEQLRKLPCRKLILATDNDKAGRKARVRIRKNVPNKMITEFIIPEGKKDVNELSKEEFDNLEEVF